MPPRRVAEEHQKAFEAYDRTRNFREVERHFESVGSPISYLTLLDWARKDYVCKWGCPYHNYQGLIDEKAKALSAAMRVIDIGGSEKQAQAEIEHSVDAAPVPTVVLPAIKGLIRSDLERIQNLEYLYSKIFFHATGIIIKYDASEKSEDILKSLYKNGLQLKSLESAVNALSAVMDEIEKLKERAGLTKPLANSEAAEKKKTDLSLSDLRKMKELAANTSPDKLKDLMSVMDMENAKPADGK